ncbi:MAG: sigma-54-dependent Fis family transcriptional regulator [Pseudomonadales bacterium]|nr:sigma-54-dependent Fis family transcriptional regulator [Pseudomonadales bacterium]
MHQVLIVEDEKVIRKALERLLSRNGYKVTTAGSVDEAESNDLSLFDLIISDLRLPGRQGTDLISLAEKTPVLIMTSYSGLKSAVAAMRQGAVDYIAKPFDHEEMLAAIANIIAETPGKKPSSTDKNDTLQSAPAPTKAEEPVGSAIIGQCEAMQHLFKQIKKVAPTGTTVLILGESGTGKELVAKEIHHHSPRRNGPLISVNCAAIPETLIESELFGHEKGAFTGATSRREGLVEAANGGSLFLDEIGELPLEAQARLLRLLQEKEVRRVGAVNVQKVDVRVIAATHRNLKELSETGEFRQDLYYRLNVVSLKLPPLRARRDDIMELAQFFLKRCCDKMGLNLKYFAPSCTQLMCDYHWPGNVRELENAIERAVILSDADTISKSELGLEEDGLPSFAPESPPPLAQDNDSEPDDAEESLEDYFQRFVLENQDNMTETELAQKLGISRKNLWERRKRFGIPRKKGGQK